MKINAAIVLQLHSEDRHYHHQQGTTTINPVTHVVCWLRMADMCSNQITIENPKETLQRKERSLNQTVRNGCLLMRHKASFLKDKAHQHTDTYTRLTALLLHQHTDIYIRQCLYFSCTNTLTLTPDRLPFSFTNTLTHTGLCLYFSCTNTLTLTPDRLPFSFTNTLTLTLDYVCTSPAPTH